MNYPILNIQRIIFLTKRQWVLNQQLYLIFSGIVFGLLILSVFASLVFSSAFYINQIVAQGLTFMYISGFLLSSSMFNELHNESKSAFYLTLPSSSSEKALNSWLFSGLLFIVTWLTMVALILIVSNLVSLFIHGATQPLSNINYRHIGLNCLNYLVLHTIFLFGAVFFRRYNFIKTILTLIGLSVGIAIISIILARLFLGPGPINDEILGQDFVEFMGERFAPAVKFFYWYILGPLMLLLTWLRLKEREV